MSINVSQLVIDLGWVVIILGAFFWALREIEQTLKGVYQFYRWVFLEVPQKYRDKKLVDKAVRAGCLLVYNTEAGITAVTRVDEFAHELANEFGKSRSSSKSTNSGRALVAPLRVMPTRTFTFADEDEGCNYVTGTTRDQARILRTLVWQVTGYHGYQVSRSAWKYAESLLVKKDKRLLVPFVREGHLPNGSLMLSLEAQCDMIGKLTLEDAARELLAQASK